jgi:ATP-dependent helicase HrpB
VANRLGGADAEIVTLHGRQSGSTQDAALRPSPVRRVVLATAVAESSLTVPGVRAVVDAGLSRVPRMDHSRGLGALVTVPVSRAAATQRAGRAGREAPGRVYRCWSQAQHDRLPAQPEPEIAAADLTGFALDLAQWGHPDGTGLSLPDPPPPGAMLVATGTLRALGATDAGGRITARGRALADAGLHPRLARALLDGARTIGPRRAAEVVALLDADRTADDLATAWRRARADRDPAWRTEVRRLTAATTRNPGADETGREWLADDLAAGLIVGLAYPERVAKVREPGGRAYLMAGGTAADLTGGSGLAGTTWLAIADADRAPGARTARVRSAAPLDEATARAAKVSACSPGREPRPSCGRDWRSRTPRWATRGRPSTTSSCWRSWRTGFPWASPAAARTWRRSTLPAPCAACSPGRWRAAWTTWPPNASRSRAAPRCGSTTPTRRPRSSRSRCRRPSAGATLPAWPTAASRSCCTCSPRPAGRWR